MAISVFGYEKTIQAMYANKNRFVIDRRRSKNHYALIKDITTFIYDHTIHHGRKHFCRYCIQASIAEILKLHVRNSFKINDKQRINMPKNGEYVKLRNFKSMFCRF